MKTHYLVWDLPLRLFHWLLVLTFSGLWLTAELGSEYMQYHVYCGYFMLFLLTFRVIWGILGTQHSKFVSFFPTFSRVRAYLTPKPNQIEPAGHNPLGAMMVFLMLLLLFTQAISGLFITDDIFTSGPYNGVLESRWEKLCDQLHYWCFTLLQVCVLLHLAAMVFYKIKKNKNLVVPMFTGKKSSDEISEQEGIKHSKLFLAVIIAIAVAAFVYWLVVINAPVLDVFYYY